MSLSNYAENMGLRHFFGNEEFSSESVLFLALATGDFTDTGLGAEPASWNEPAAASGYARALVNNTQSANGWSVVAGNSPSYTLHRVETTFGKASGNWGTIGYFGLFDAATDGYLYGYGSVTVPRTVVSGDIPMWASGALIAGVV